MGGYRVFRKDRLGIGGRETMLYPEEQPECMEVCHEMVHKPVESLHDRIKGRLVRKLL